MKKIQIKREEHIIQVLDITIAAFNAHGIEISRDQAHCLWDLAHWFGGLDIEDEQEWPALIKHLLENAEVITP